MRGKTKMIIKHKRGWIKIVEAFTAILLITGFLLIVFDREDLQNQGSSQKIYDEEQKILLEIQLNDSLRNEILSYNSENFPVEMESFSNALKESIITKTPSYLNCTGKVCSVQEDCGFGVNQSEEVYVQRILISANLDTYNPRELSLFCWVK